MHAAFCFECRRGIRTTACQQLAQQHRIRPSQNVMADGQPPDVLLLENRSLRQKLMRIQNLFMQLLIACYSQPNNIGAVLGDIQQVLNESSDVISPGAGAESHVWWWLHHIYHQQAPQPMHSCSPRVQQPCCHSHRAQPATATLGSPACRCSSTRCSSNRAPRQQPPSRARPDPIRPSSSRQRHCKMCPPSRFWTTCPALRRFGGSTNMGTRRIGGLPSWSSTPSMATSGAKRSVVLGTLRCVVTHTNHLAGIRTRPKGAQKPSKPVQ